MKRDRALRCAFFLFVLGLMASLPVLAQKITGDISGTVQDTTGAVVKDTKVTAINGATGETRSANTSDSGFYRILELPPGTYKVTATAPGFKTSAREVQVAIASVTQSDFQLQPGQVSETIEVEGAAPLVETTEDRLSTLFVGRQVADLPNNGRDFNNLLDGVPGVQRSPGGGFQSLNIDGQRATSNNFAVDGIPNNDRYYGESSLGQAAISGTAAALIPLEGISEFNVESNPGVEFGVKGGSVINIGLKSGTNDLHGSAFWDRHTDAFDARNGFASTVTPFRLNQFGASGGFPIKKDKAFVFLSYQGFHLKDSFPSHVLLPTANQIADATSCVTTGVNPNTSGTIGPDGNPWTTCLNTGPGPGSDQIFGTADDGTVNSIGAELLSFIPTSTTGSANITADNSLDLNNFHVKFDYVFSPSHRLSVKYLFGDSLQSQPSAPGVPQSIGPLATNKNMWNSVAPTRAQLAGLNYTWTITPTSVLESRFGYQRFSQRIGVNNNIDPNALGISTGPLGANSGDKENFGVPAVYYLGYFGPSAYSVVGGVQGYPIITRPDASYDWQEHFTKIKGNHTIKIGGQFQDAYTKSRRDRARSNMGFYYYGFENCGGDGNCNPLFGADAAGDPQVTQGNPVAALNELLLGLTEDSGRSFGVTDRRIFQKSLGLYVQDSWKVRPNFTLELGVRWDVAGALGEAKNQGANFLPDDPKADANGFVSLADHPLYNADKNNFGPRAGFAWDVFGKGRTVLRAGYSLGYDLPNFGVIHAPQTASNMWSGTRDGFFTQVPEGIFAIDISTTPADNQATFNSGTKPNSLCADFICMASNVNIYGQSATPTPPFNVVQVQRNFATPMNHAYNLTVEQQLSNKTSFSLAFVGTAGRDLINWRDLNACPVSATDPCDTSRQPFGTRFPQYNHILQLNNDGFSNYNSLQTAFKVRDLHGLSGQLNFVWSRSFDNGSANRGGSFVSDFQNPYLPDKSYAPADFDTPWNVNFTMVYVIPQFHSVPKLLGDGWQINSLFRAQEGRPYTAFVSGDPSNQGLKETFAVYDGSPLDYDNHYLAHGKTSYFNTDAFSAPAPGQIGNARNVVREPSIAQLDMGLFKNFQLTERFSVKFKWEVFNVLNHAMFAAAFPGKVGSNSFGTLFATPDVGLGLNPVLGVGAARNMQFGLSVAF
jgi:Carboxypeptidase regulatory-like domain/TonB dependent receptor/TonB-dependent Receptor Plug Domain